MTDLRGYGPGLRKSFKRENILALYCIILPKVSMQNKKKVYNWVSVASNCKRYEKGYFALISIEVLGVESKSIIPSVWLLTAEKTDD